MYHWKNSGYVLVSGVIFGWRVRGGLVTSFFTVTVVICLHTLKNKYWQKKCSLLFNFCNYFLSLSLPFERLPLRLGFSCAVVYFYYPPCQQFLLWNLLQQKYHFIKISIRKKIIFVETYIWNIKLLSLL